MSVSPSSSNMKEIYLGVSLNVSKPYLSIDGDAVVALSPDPSINPQEQKELFNTLIIKLQGGLTAVDSEASQQAVHIFDLVIKKQPPREHCWQLASELREHLSLSLFHRQQEKVDAQDDLADLAALIDDTVLLSLDGMQKEGTRPAAPVISPRDFGIPLIGMGEGYDRVRRRNSVFQAESSEEEEEQETRVRSSSVGRKQQELEAYEHQCTATVHSLSDLALEDYIIYWRDHGADFPDLYSADPVKLNERHTSTEEQARLKRLLVLPVEQWLQRPLRRLVSQEQIQRMLASFPATGSNWAQDLDRTLRLITVVGEKASLFDLSNHEEKDDKQNFVDFTGRFREILNSLLEKLSTPSSECLHKWDEIVGEVVSYDNNSPAECFEKFFTFIIDNQDKIPVVKQLGHLLRASFQSSYTIPGTGVRSLFAKGEEKKGLLFFEWKEESVGRATIEYIFSGDTIQVITKKMMKYTKTKNKKKEFFVVVKNTLSSTLQNLSSWKSAILVEIPQGSKTKEEFLNSIVLVPLLQGGFVPLTTKNETDK